MYSVAPVSSGRYSARIIANAERSIALRAQARLAGRLEQALDHVAPGGDDHDAGARAVGGLDDPERVVLEHGLLERHRDVVLAPGSGSRRRSPWRP